MNRGKPNPVAARGARLRPLDPVWARYRRLLARCQRQLTEDALHDLRVQTRRLLAGLEVFSPVAGGRAKAAPARKSLRKRLAVFGPLRDAQVHLRDFGSALAAHPEVGPLHQPLRRREKRLRKSALAKLDRTGTRKLGRRFQEYSDRLAIGLAGAEAAAILRLAFAQSMTDAVAKLDRESRRNFRDRRAVHAARVALKQVRYGAECLPPGLRGSAPAELRRVRKCVALLGRIHDVDVQLARLEKLVAKGRLPANDAKTYGADLSARRAALSRECLALWRRRRVRPASRADQPVAAQPAPRPAPAGSGAVLTASAPVSSLPG